jgi:phage shock protein A
MTEQEKQKLEKTNTKISQLQAQREAILAREKERQRKERTRRLIQNGALAEKYLNCEGIEPKEFEKLLQRLVNSNKS